MMKGIRWWLWQPSGPVMRGVLTSLLLANALVWPLTAGR